MHRRDRRSELLLRTSDITDRRSYMTMKDKEQTFNQAKRQSFSMRGYTGEISC